MDAGIVLCDFDGVLTPTSQRRHVADQLGVGETYRGLDSLYETESIAGIKAAYEEKHSLLQEAGVTRTDLEKAGETIPLRDHVTEFIDTVQALGWQFTVFSYGIDHVLATALQRVNVSRYTAAFTPSFTENGTVTHIGENPAWNKNTCREHYLCKTNIVKQAQQTGPVLVIDDTFTCPLDSADIGVLFEEDMHNTTGTFTGHHVNTLEEVTQLVHDVIP